MKNQQIDFRPYTRLDFNIINQQITTLINLIETETENLVSLLILYESYEVVYDELARTLDLLRSLRENEQYFKLRVGVVAAFLPRNQPLYAFTCFVVIPSLMASEVHFRIPHVMKNFFPDVIKLLSIYTLFPNIRVSSKERNDFLRERSALLINSETKESKPVTDAVIFTGTPIVADHIRMVFDRRTLFITNGAGHNPIIVSETANLSNAIEAVLSLTLYNQGQDCAAPNSILVHQDIYSQFMMNLHVELPKIKIGPYKDPSCRIGPISNPEDLKRIEELLVDNREWLDKSTQGIIRTGEAIVEPTIICKPLNKGGNYDECFAPVFFIQKYKDDLELSLYFENKQYIKNAMYVTLYGKSHYVENLIERTFEGRILHDKNTFLHNTHLHIPGIERGVNPYGGYGYGASSISINGKIIAMPTLPQRDIYMWVAKPIIDMGLESYKIDGHKFTETKNKNVEKLLKLQRIKIEKPLDTVKSSKITYFDLNSIKTDGTRFVKIEEYNIHHLLNEPNVEYIAALDIKDIHYINALKILLMRKSKLTLADFTKELYALVEKSYQLYFFRHVYQLLFGAEAGPKLAPFLWEIKEGSVDPLLDI